MFAIGYNMPGFLPESEPVEYETWQEAREALLEEINRVYDERFDTLQDPYDAFLDNTAHTDAIQTINDTTDNNDVTAFYAGYAYWITCT